MSGPCSVCKIFGRRQAVSKWGTSKNGRSSPGAPAAATPPAIWPGTPSALRSLLPAILFLRLPWGPAAARTPCCVACLRGPGACRLSRCRQRHGRHVGVLAPSFQAHAPRRSIGNTARPDRIFGACDGACRHPDRGPALRRRPARARGLRPANTVRSRESRDTDLRDCSSGVGNELPWGHPALATPQPGPARPSTPCPAQAVSASPCWWCEPCCATFTRGQ